MKTLTQFVRQLAFPQELRIQSTGTLPPAFTVDDLNRLFSKDHTGRADSVPPDDEAHRCFIRKLATGVWRLGRQISRLDGSKLGCRVKTRMEVLGGILHTQGIEIVDFAGKPYDANEIWDEVISSPEEKADPIIASMREPRVNYQGAVIQRGQPVVEDRIDLITEEERR